MYTRARDKQPPAPHAYSLRYIYLIFPNPLHAVILFNISRLSHKITILRNKCRFKKKLHLLDFVFLSFLFSNLSNKKSSYLRSRYLYDLVFVTIVVYFLNTVLTIVCLY